VGSRVTTRNGILESSILRKKIMQKNSPVLAAHDIRKKVRQRRRELDSSLRYQSEQSIYQQLQQHPKILAAKHIAIFLSFDGELNTQPIIEYLWQQNKSVYLPIIHPFNRKHLMFLRYDRHTQLARNQFGILEPKLNVDHVIPFHQLNVVLTPLVAFDHRNYRIGMGGGYYDRLLADYQKTSVYPIGIAFNCQQIAHIDNQPWDVQLPEIISA